jgi:hypothetical protein
MTADIYTRTSAKAERNAAIALERAIYGDLFPVVLNVENRNTFGGAKLGGGIVASQLVTTNKEGRLEV